MPLELPSAPLEQPGPVKVCFEPVLIPTYLPQPPDKNPDLLAQLEMYPIVAMRWHMIAADLVPTTRAREHSTNKQTNTTNG